MFGALAAHIEADLTPHVVQLRSSMCRGLKGVVKTVVDALLKASAKPSDIAKQGSINYDIQILQSWFADQEQNDDEDADDDGDGDAEDEASGTRSKSGGGGGGGAAATEEPLQDRRRPIVVIFEDFEAFDVEALSDFIVVCSQRRATLPIAFLFGVASSAGILARQLPRKAICALNTSKFRLRQSSATLSDVVSQVLMSPKHPFKLGPRPVQKYYPTGIC